MLELWAYRYPWTLNPYTDLLNPPWSFIHELVNKTLSPMTDQQSAMKVQGNHRSRGTEREQWCQRVRGMTDKISIWISIQVKRKLPTHSVHVYGTSTPRWSLNWALGHSKKKEGLLSVSQSWDAQAYCSLGSPRELLYKLPWVTPWNS